MRLHAPPSADLDACDREPVHAPAGIQPQGVLLATDERLRLVCLSRNLHRALPGAEFDRGLDELLAIRDLPELLAPLRRRLPRPFRPRFSADTNKGIQEQLTEALLAPTDIELQDAPYRLLLDRNDAGLLLFELERAELDDPAPAAVLETLQPSVAALEATAVLQALLDRLVTTVRQLTGFERVMAYRFGRDGHGEVIAEDASAQVPSFLGLHYPSSDIPRPVRELFLRNPVRLIVDRDAVPVPLQPTAIASGLDLGPAVYRGLSPVHQAYLRNMDVGASMSVALVREGRLWGLIACHHRQPRRVPFAIRQACEILAIVATRQLAKILEREVGVRLLPLAGVGESLVAAVGAGKHLGDALGDAAAQLASAVDARGFAVLTPTHLYAAGELPSEALVRDACAAAEQRQPGTPLFDSEHLGSLLPGRDLEGVGGLIGTLLPGHRDTRLVWFRGQEPREVRWAGDPREPKIQDETGRLHPRASFALWKEARREHCREWDEADERVVLAMRERVVDLAVQLADQLSERASAVAETNRKLTEINEELEHFVQAASHDLRAPLRAVGNITRWIEEDETQLSHTAREHLELLRSRVQRMDQLLQDLLAYARAGRTGRAKEDLALTELALEVVDELAPPATFRVEVGADLPHVRAARVGMRQVLMNLINNAVIHHDRDGGRIRIRGGVDARGTWLGVEDDGPGIPAANREQAFAMFQVLDQREGQQGSGLGLALVRRELQAQGGSVEISSAEPRGTRVLLRWPATMPETNPASPTGHA